MYEQTKPVERKVKNTWSTKKVFNESAALAQSLLMSTYAQSLQSVNIGFSLAAALAWNEAVKHYLSKNLRDIKQSNYYHVMYALIVTFLTALVFMITKTFLDRNAKKVQPMPVVGF